MEDKLIKILDIFGYPIYRQGSMSEDEIYPETFFTFWNNGSEDLSHYDNKSYGTEWDFDINVYSSDPIKTYAVLDDTILTLQAAGWTIESKGHDIGSDEPTHTGRGVRAFFMQYKEE